MGRLGEQVIERFELSRLLHRREFWSDSETQASIRVESENTSNNKSIKTMNKIDLEKLKQTLPLPQLLKALGYGDGNLKKLCCPLHDDHSPSLSIFRKKNGGWGWKCHAGCGSGDEIDFLAKLRGLDPKKDFRKIADEYAQLATAASPQIPNTPASLAPPNPSSMPAENFDWDSLRKSADAKFLGNLASMRGYSLGLIDWLAKLGLVGNFKGQVAFPVRDAGGIIGAHVRNKNGQGWFFVPKGIANSPLIIGDLSHATKIHAFESQWDAFAFCELQAWHTSGIPADAAIFITRGAANGGMVGAMVRGDATVYAWIQNDKPNAKTGIVPAEEWLKAICTKAKTVWVVKTPGEHKDPNDWLRAGATSADFADVIATAMPAEITAAPPASAENTTAVNTAPPSPNEWFEQQFPGLTEKYGPAALEQSPKDSKGQPYVKLINEDFLAATLGAEGSPDEPAVFLPVEDKFYKYMPADGIYRQKSLMDLEGMFSAIILECARACLEHDIRSLLFSHRKSSVLSGVSRRAKAILKGPDEFFDATVKDFIACHDCMVRVADLLPVTFSPLFQRRNMLTINFVPDAKCDRFLNELMRPALDEADLDLLQRWSGMALMGENSAQKIVLLTGMAGGGKGTFINVLLGIIGRENVGELRTKHLEKSRFELGLLAGKTLLYGGDVAADFLNEEGASSLKKITGGDPISPEHKNSGTTRTLECRFNVVVSANCRLRIRLEKDAAAWRRRLVIIDYVKKPPAKPIADFAKILLRDEGPGILNWMLVGLKKLEADGWQLNLNAEQQARVDSLLLESDSVMVFTRDAFTKDQNLTVTVSDAFDSYTEYCQERGWTPVPRHDFGGQIEKAIAAQYGAALRHDILDPCSYKPQRGWKGIGLCR
jgi:P4 family phage/plasmid primase-like protien